MTTKKATPPKEQKFYIVNSANYPLCDGMDAVVFSTLEDAYMDAVNSYPEGDAKVLEVYELVRKGNIKVRIDIDYDTKG